MPFDEVKQDPTPLRNAFFLRKSSTSAKEMARDCGFLSGAAAWRVIPETIFFTAIATAITLISKKTDLSLGISNQILTVMGAVLGLVVSFRTSSAYDRYWEARKLWATINMQSRNLARLIWVHVPYERLDKNAEVRDNSAKPNVPESDIISEKSSATLLVEAYSIAVKHFLRGERGLHFEDLHPLVANFIKPPARPKSHGLSRHWSPSSATLVGSPPRAAVRERPTPSRSTTMSSLPSLKGSASFNAKPDVRVPDSKIRRIFKIESQRRSKNAIPSETFVDDEKLPTALAPAQQGPHRCHIREWIPFAFRAIFHLGSQFLQAVRNVFRGERCAPLVDSEKGSLRSVHGYRTMDDEFNVPLQITICLSGYIQWLLKHDLIKPAVALGFTNGIVALEDITSQLDRIKTTPIPSAYQDHLRLSLWLYLFFFPFQVLETLGYFTILATAMYAYVLLGFMEIGRDIENPFTYLMNNLDLDQFCRNIKRDLRQVASHNGLEMQPDRNQPAQTPLHRDSIPLCYFV
ncbi:UPF0187-domain-containing protein [Schizopora paradoxa]|uniref:UPF0187-domain-containing protein n=1 Tax=Schizopora paradoxa TaxID=27342 RepID=A0A0H2S6P6_9AGAM|nr:UPF0187-domain-containing protein [Schizopora paradoxa]